MKKIAQWSVLSGLFTSVLPLLIAQVPAAPAPVPYVPPVGFAQAIVLWPGGAPLAKGSAEGDVPKLYSYPAPGDGAHAAVIVMPGGGYNHLVMGKEGDVEARWLNAHGVSAYVLEYRLSPGYLFPAPMLDGARAVRYVRSHASEIHVRPDQIGVWGFSAGGHLAGYLATTNDPGNASSDDPIERTSDRPDFAIFSYARLSMDRAIPRNGSMESLVGEHASPTLLDTISPVLHVTAQSSPSFLYSTSGDMSVDSRNATSFYDALKRAGVPAELHVFERGPHGTGMAQTLAPELSALKVWPLLLANWMQEHGWMPPQP